MYQWVIAGGQIVDGTGRPPYPANLAINQGKVARISESPLEGETTLSVKGKLVAPGFIDLHGHSEFTLLADPRGASKLLQGVTTEIVGNCGGWVAPLTGLAEEKARKRAQTYGAEHHLNWDTVDQYLTLLQATQPAINVGVLVGHSNLRAVTIGSDDRPANGRDLEQMGQCLKDMLAQGAWGMSAGLYYAPGSFATQEEMSYLLRELAKFGALYTCHMRDEGENAKESVEEMVRLALTTGAKSQIAHIKAFGTRSWHKAPQLIDVIEAGRHRGADLWADQYPYIASDTRISGSMLSLARWAESGGREKFLERLANPTTRERITAEVQEAIALRGGPERILISEYDPKPHWAGRYLADLAQEHHLCPAHMVLKMLEAGDGRTSCFSMHEDDLERFMQAPWVAVASDGRALAVDGPLRTGHPHPRSFGTFPRVLGRYVRERGILAWEEAIRKMTSLPADILGLHQRGRLQEGGWADVVVFDPRTVEDKSTFTAPFAYPIGIDHVWVNGQLAVESGQITGQQRGMILRKTDEPLKSN